MAHAVGCIVEAMIVSFEIPETMAESLDVAGGDLSRAALEALALDGYRTEKLSEEQVRVMLGYQTRMQVHALLKQHGVPLQYSVSDFEDDLRTLRELQPKTAAA